MDVDAGQPAPEVALSDKDSSGLALQATQAAHSEDPRMPYRRIRTSKCVVQGTAGSKFTPQSMFELIQLLAEMLGSSRIEMRLSSEYRQKVPTKVWARGVDVIRSETEYTALDRDGFDNFLSSMSERVVRSLTVDLRSKSNESRAKLVMGSGGVDSRGITISVNGTSGDDTFFKVLPLLRTTLRFAFAKKAAALALWISIVIGILAFGYSAGHMSEGLEKWWSILRSFVDHPSEHGFNLLFGRFFVPISAFATAFILLYKTRVVIRHVGSDKIVLRPSTAAQNIASSRRQIDTRIRRTWQALSELPQSLTTRRMLMAITGITIAVMIVAWVSGAAATALLAWLAIVVAVLAWFFPKRPT